MKTFDEVLRENNVPLLLQGRYKAGLEAWYNEKVRRYEELRKAWEENRELLRSRFGVEVPIETAHPFQVKFSTYQEAKEIIDSAWIPTVDSLYNDQEDILRRLWVQRILADAIPTCRLISVRDLKYEFNDRQEKYIQNRLEKYEPDYLEDEAKMIHWIAFYPGENLDKLHLFSWAMFPMETSISYRF